MERYQELLAFLDENGRMPKESGGTPAEVRLGSWVRYQRRRFTREIMPTWQLTLLAEINELAWNPSGEKWIARLARLRAFLHIEKRMPRYRSSDPTERALAAWVHKQRYLHRRGKLPANRVAALRRLPFRIL